MHELIRIVDDIARLLAGIKMRLERISCQFLTAGDARQDTIRVPIKNIRQKIETDLAHPPYILNSRCGCCRFENIPV
ncbi:MAG: hypothetical protein P4L50_08730 [Anaerolineaceae bacterium]|nr:hypothetical protein [Anaerolineaceae bacterium]